MVAINLENFGGMIPAVDKRLLPDNHADLSENTWVYSGTLQGIFTPVPVYTCQSATTKKVYRIPIQYYDKDHIEDSYWLEFDIADTDVIRSPTIQDEYDRYYWAHAQDIVAGPPMYNTRDRIIADDPPLLLGIPAPETAITIGVISGGTAPVEDRAYVYTYVSAYGEESAPSPPVSGNGNANATWNLSWPAPGAGVTDDRNLTHINIYRTITSSDGTATYYFVDQVDIADTAYADAVAGTTVSASRVLKSIYWTPPPEDLEGMVSMPNGMVAGWRGNEVWFCEPYRPHAWPVTYTVAVEFPIVGMGVIGQTLIVCTTGSPFAISGTNPSVMAVSRIARVEPCLSRASVVSTPLGVAYASSNGLAIAVPGRVDVVSRSLVNKDDWQSLLQLPTLRGATLNGGYYCWGSVRAGCFDSGSFESTAFLQDDFTGSYTGAFIDINDNRVAYHRLSNPEVPTLNVMTDDWTGELFLLRDGVVEWLDVASAREQNKYKWRSKLFNLRSKKNLGAMRLWFDLDGNEPELNATRNVDLVQELAADQWALVRIYADDVLVYTNELRTSGEMMRLPSGFKAQYYQIEVESRITITKIEVASTVKELQSV